MLWSGCESALKRQTQITAIYQHTITLHSSDTYTISYDDKVKQLVSSNIMCLGTCALVLCRLCGASHIRTIRERRGQWVHRNLRYCGHGGIMQVCRIYYIYIWTNDYDYRMDFTNHSQNKMSHFIAKSCPCQRVCRMSYVVCRMSSYCCYFLVYIILLSQIIPNNRNNRDFAIYLFPKGDCFPFYPWFHMDPN